MRTAPAVIAAALAIFVAGCGSGSTSSGTPSPSPVPGNSTTQVKFVAQLTTPAETPPIVAPDPEAGGTGTANITLNVTKDPAGNINAATVDFQVNLSGFPNGTPINIAHIHTGAAGVAGGILVSTGLNSGDLVLTNGSGSFTKTAVGGLDAAHATDIINNPANYYFNVHSTLHPGGVARGQLVKQ
jgi:hypothetical protein